MNKNIRKTNQKNLAALITHLEQFLRGEERLLQIAQAIHTRFRDWRFKVSNLFQQRQQELQPPHDAVGLFPLCPPEISDRLDRFNESSQFLNQFHLVFRVQNVFLFLHNLSFFHRFLALSSRHHLQALQHFPKLICRSLLSESMICS